MAQKKLLETAYALLDNGVSLDVVIKFTGLSCETLENPQPGWGGIDNKGRIV